jgi:hypothetical protein
MGENAKEEKEFDKGDTYWQEATAQTCTCRLK